MLYLNIPNNICFSVKQYQSIVRNKCVWLEIICVIISKNFCNSPGKYKRKYLSMSLTQKQNFYGRFKYCNTGHNIISYDTQWVQTHCKVAFELPYTYNDFTSYFFNSEDCLWNCNDENSNSNVAFSKRFWLHCVIDILSYLHHK